MHKVQNLDYTCFTKLLLMQLCTYVRVSILLTFFVFHLVTHGNKFQIEILINCFNNLKNLCVLLQSIQANMGNTEVYRPLHSIFLLKPENSLRNIFVISDGHVNNEETTLKAVHDNCQHTRVFTFGVRYILYFKRT